VVPGRALSLDFIRQALKRRFWWIATPFVLLSAAGSGLALKLPNTYRSQTVILVIPQRVPETYVRSTVTLPLEGRLRSITEQILSRTRLERIIQEFNLYQEERKVRLMEDVVQKMSDSVTLTLGKEQSFTLTFTYGDAAMAAKVADRLASLFIDENLRDRETQAEGTSQFLEGQLEEARRRLIEHEKKLEEYRKRYAGQLPTQLPSNLQNIQTTQTQINSLIEATNRLRDRRIAVERQIADAENTPAPVAPVAPVTAGTTPDPTAVGGGTTAQQLETANRNLRAMEARGLTPQHPDVVRIKRTIKDLEEQVATEAASAAATKPPVPVTASAIAARARLDALKTELANTDRQIASNEQTERRLQDKIADYQARIEAVPTRESELTELTRDYDTLQASYKSLLAKREDSQLAANLERRQGGQQFKVLDAARIPEKAASPNRPLIAGGAAFVGLVLGLALGGLREFRDGSLRTEEDVLQGLELPVLAFVPTVVTVFDRARLRRRTRTLIVTTVALCTLLVTVGVFVWKTRF
jgi:polysaccharide chain length determinant protein (PEP-CTERM system associated)